jgi:nucleotide-binding universal stress UspA family protein
MFTRLLLAVDDSSSGEVAISFASSLARQCSASVHVLHVNEYLVGGRGLTLSTSDEATRLVVDAVRQLQSVGIPADGSVCIGSCREVADRIVQVAQGHHADGILLGSRRRRRLGSLFSPRVRERTLRLTALPVLTAPSPLTISKGIRAETVDAPIAPQKREETRSR